MIPQVLILKQYQCGVQPTNDLKFVPLGYIHGMFSAASGSVAASQRALSAAEKPRPYRWVFAGALIHERKTAYDEQFQFWKPHQVIKGLDGKQLGELYASADFVLSGRGENLDCYRHYESSSNGAIPIIAAPMAELKRTFGHYNPQPPWIMAETWSEAFAQAHALSPADIIQKRKEVLNWWIQTVNSLQQTIQSRTNPNLKLAQHKHCDGESTIELTKLWNRIESTITSCAEWGCASAQDDLPQITTCWRQRVCFIVLAPILVILVSTNRRRFGPLRKMCRSSSRGHN